MAKNPHDPAMFLTKEQYTHPAGILVSDHYTQPYGYSCYRPHGTKDWLIMYTLSGKGSINNGSNSYLTCTAGSLTILSPGSLQDYFTDEGHTWEKLWAHFMPRLHWMDWLPQNNQNGSIFHLHIDNESSRRAIESAFWRLISYRLNSESYLWDELTLNALEEVILLIASDNQPKKELDSRVQEVLDLISQNYMETIRVEEIASKVCLSPSRLSHLFKEQVGDSIVETVTKHRLKQAEKRLLYTLRSISDISFEVGFNTPDYFSRRFADYYGLSPINYRKQFRKMNFD